MKNILKITAFDYIYKYLYLKYSLSISIDVSNEIDSIKFYN